MDQGKLDVVRQEMTRLNIDILGIIELKWIEMGEFNSEDHYFYYCGQESLRRTGVALTVKKESELQYFGATSKTTEWSHITVIQVCAPVSDTKEAEQFYEDLQDFL